MGTLGGNIGNESPIGHGPPVLIALDAEIALRKGSDRRTVPLEKYFIDYGKQDLEPGEFVEEIRIPLATTGQIHAAYKISKRRDEDISLVAAGFRVTVDNGVVTDARIAFGGMAATPKRASGAEAPLVGAPWSEATLLCAAETLSDDFTPLTDWRASAGYRMRVAKNLFRRFWIERGDIDTPARLSA